MVSWISNRLPRGLSGLKVKCKQIVNKALILQSIDSSKYWYFKVLMLQSIDTSKYWYFKVLILQCIEKYLNIWTGVLLGDINGEAKGDWGSEACRGDIGWKLKCLLRVPGLCPELLSIPPPLLPLWCCEEGGGCVTDWPPPPPPWGCETCWGWSCTITIETC